MNISLARYGAPLLLIAVVHVHLNARILEVGSGKALASPNEAAAAAEDGDTVLIDKGMYEQQACTWNNDNLVIRGVEKYAHLKGADVIPNQKAIWVIIGENTIVENVEFSDASVPDQNGAGIRAEGKNLTIRSCWFHDNEDGILGGNGTVRIENSEFGYNGFGDGFSHNMYISNCDTFIIRFCYSHHAKIGHELKSRAAVNIIEYNRLMNESDGTASYEIDLPNGGTSYIIGNLIQQGPETDNSTIVMYGAEGLSNPGKDVWIVNNTIVNDRSGGTFIRIADGSSGHAINNLFAGPGTDISGPCEKITNLTAGTDILVDAAACDYHPVAGSAVENGGTDPGSAHGVNLMPAFQYVHPLGSESRVVTGAPDIGAFEYGPVVSTKQLQDSRRQGFIGISGSMYKKTVFIGDRCTGTIDAAVDLKGRTDSRINAGGAEVRISRIY
jgi:hypothetical protein